MSETNHIFFICMAHAQDIPLPPDTCPYCEIDRLNAELKEVQTAYDELRLLADGRLSIKPEYVREIERQLASMTEKHNWQCEQRIDIERQLTEARAEVERLTERLQANAAKIDNEDVIIEWHDYLRLKAASRQEAVMEVIEMMVPYLCGYGDKGISEIKAKFGLEG